MCRRMSIIGLEFVCCTRDEKDGDYVVSRGGESPSRKPARRGGWPLIVHAAGEAEPDSSSQVTHELERG
jgi:hypothetical protein